MRFFLLNKIPENLIFGHRKRIEDAIGGIGGSMAVTEEVVAPNGKRISYAEIDEVCKLSREDRLEFYEQMLGKAEIRIKTEVGKRQ